MARTNPFTKLAATLVACATLAIGCGTQNSPVSSDEDAVTAAPEGRSFLAFSPRALERAGKISANVDAGHTVSAVFTQAGGVLHILENNSELATDDLEALFVVRPNSIPSLNLDTDALANIDGVLITMTIYGNTLEDLVVEFEPGGLEFDPVARLNLRLGLDLVNTPLDEIVIWHVHDDGTVEEAVFHLRSSKTNLYLSIEVPGFSRYSPGGGWKPVAPLNGGRVPHVSTQSRYSSGGGW